jgi:hypothetical protein
MMIGCTNKKGWERNVGEKREGDKVTKKQGKMKGVKDEVNKRSSYPCDTKLCMF